MLDLTNGYKYQVYVSLLLHLPVGAVKPKAMVLNQGNFASLGHQKTFGDATLGGKEGATGI